MKGRLAVVAACGLSAGFVFGASSDAVAEASGAIVDRGIVGGWRVHSQDARVVVVSPDGKFVLTGRLYGAEGQDIGAALTGTAPVGLGQAILTSLPVLRDARSGSGSGDCSLFPPGAGFDLAEPAASPLVENDRTGAMPEQAAPRASAVAASRSDIPEAPAGEVVDVLTAAYGFDVGIAGPTVVMVADPACPWCATAVDRLRPALEEGAIRMRVVPVAVVSPQSTKAVAAILTHSDPAARFVEYMVEKARNSNADPGPLHLDNLTTAMRDGVQANIDTIRGFGIRQVPFFAWRDAAGKAHTLTGLPEDAVRFLAAGPADGAR